MFWSANALFVHCVCTSCKTFSVSGICLVLDTCNYLCIFQDSVSGKGHAVQGTKVGAGLDPEACGFPFLLLTSCFTPHPLLPTSHSLHPTSYTPSPTPSGFGHEHNTRSIILTRYLQCRMGVNFKTLDCFCLLWIDQIKG